MTSNGGELSDGAYYKMNVYNVGPQGANTGTEFSTGLAFLIVVRQYFTTLSITIHGFGHALTYTEKYGVNQIRKGLDGKQSPSSWRIHTKSPSWYFE